MNPKNKNFSIQIILIFTYTYFINLSINLFPLNIILGLLCVFFLPGYNLLNLIKPKSNLIEKLGLVPIISLAIGNIFMFFSYLILYDFVTSSEHPGFIFDPIFLVNGIQIINLLLLILKEFFDNKKKKENFLQFNSVLERHKINKEYNKLSESFQSLIKKTNIKTLIVYSCFIFSLICLCLSAFNGSLKNTKFGEINKAYRMNYTFFNKVSPTFFIFLTIAILSFVYIIFVTENIYLRLFSISAFIYCIWILPYLQIWNYFGVDSYYLFNFYKSYVNGGLKSNSIQRFNLGNYALRYSTSFFTAVLLTSATNVSINIALWFLYPLIFIFLPFFFFSMFKKFSNNNDNCDLNLILLSILAIFTSLFIKSSHSATTMVIGLYIFIILVVEFYEIIHDFENKIKFRDFYFIIFLYFFLCITHFEECIYFLIIIILYFIYFLFFQIKEINSAAFKKGYNRNLNEFIDNQNLKEKIWNNLLIQNIFEKQRYLKKTLISFGFFFTILFRILYLTMEFFGTINFYFFGIVKRNYFFNYLYDLYESSRVIYLPVLRGTYKISFLVIFIIIFGNILLIIAIYLCLFNLYGFFFRVYGIFLKFLVKIHFILKKLNSLKIFKFFIFIFCICSILLIDLYYYHFLQEESHFLIFEIMINYIVIIFHLVLFIGGISYYRSENHKQNYFLISILTCFILMGSFFIS